MTDVPSAAVEAEAQKISDAALSLFVRFVRLNKWVPADDPVVRRVFDAYAALPEQPEHETTRQSEPAGRLTGDALPGDAPGPISREEV